MSCLSRLNSADQPPRGQSELYSEETHVVFFDECILLEELERLLPIVVVPLLGKMENDISATRNRPQKGTISTVLRLQ